MDLYEAIHKSDLTALKRIFDSGVDVNAPLTNQMLPLELAVKSMNLDVVRFLIERGANMNALNKDGYTVLHNAVQHKYDGLVHLLIKKGANLDIQTPAGYTPLMYAIIDKDAELIQLLTEAGANLDLQNKDGENAIAIAFRIKKPTFVEYLIDKGANVNIPDKDGRTPLINAAKIGRYELVELIVGTGKADLNVQDKYGKTALLWDTELGQGDENIAYVLIKAGANLDLQAKNGNTALHNSIYRGLREVAMMLIDAGANLEIKNQEGLTPLMACYLGPAEDLDDIAEALIKKGANLNEVDRSGKTALHYYALEPKIDLVKLLIEKRANLNIQDADGNTPLIVVVKYGGKFLGNAIEEIVTILVEAGADTTIKNKNGKTALDYAKTDEIRELLTGKKKSVRMWTGYSKADLENFNAMISSPEFKVNFSFCPVCLGESARIDGCKFVSHVCPPRFRHPELFAKYVDTTYGNKVWWCTVCGRPAHHEKHIVRNLPEDTELVPVPYPAGAVIDFFSNECLSMGGGDLPEKFFRMEKLIEAACETQQFVGVKTEQEVRKMVIEKIWRAVKELDDPAVYEAAKTRSAGPIVAPCELPAFSAPTVEYTVYPDIKRPVDESELKPVEHVAPDNECSVELGPQHEGKPVYQFRHKQADGSIWEHKNEYICAEDLEGVLNAEMGDFKGTCPINPHKCTARLYPEEIKDIVRPELYETYRKKFNERFAEQSGGAVEGSTLLHKIDPNELQCLVPPKKAGVRKAYRVTFKKKKQMRRRRTAKKI